MVRHADSGLTHTQAESARSDRTKCPRIECPKLKLTKIRVKVGIEVRFRIRAEIRD